MGIVTTTGLNEMLDNITAFGWMAIGTSAQTEAVSLTAMGNETQRTAITDDSVSGTRRTFATLFTSEETSREITEAGIFDASSGGNLLAYWNLSTSNDNVTKASGKELILTLQLDIANA